MASAISGYITQIQNAIYGEQVRGAIVNAITRCYDDVNSPTLTREAFTSILSDMASNGSLQEQMLNYFNIFTEGTSNKIDPVSSSIGKLDATTGEIDTSILTYYTTDWIPVNENDPIYKSLCTVTILYDANKNYIEEVPGTLVGSSRPYIVPAGGKYIRASITYYYMNRATLNIGEYVSQYTPGRSSIDYNLREDVYRKLEIDTMMADRYLTDAQEAELIALLD